MKPWNTRMMAPGETIEHLFGDGVRATITRDRALGNDRVFKAEIHRDGVVVSESQHKYLADARRTCLKKAQAIVGDLVSTGMRDPRYG